MLATRLLHESSHNAAKALQLRAGALHRKRKEIIDLTQAQKLQASTAHIGFLKGRPELREDDILPIGYHLIYFTPYTMRECDLGDDGSDTTFNPVESTFTRRMWAGGSLHYSLDNPMRIGQLVEEETKLSGIQCKTTAQGEAMLVVSATKSFYNAQGLSLEERRDWLFREAAPVVTKHAQTVTDSIKLNDIPAESIKFSSTTLFRYSALTYNSHKIHLDRDWCREREGQPDLVVHGPLLLTLMLQKASAKQMISSVHYRAHSPCYVNDFIEIEHDHKQVQCQSSDGRLLMRAQLSNT